jgi:hypothetical protein
MLFLLCIPFLILCALNVCSYGIIEYKKGRVILPRWEVSILTLISRCVLCEHYLVSASRGTRAVSSLWAGGTCLGLTTLEHHLGEVDFSTDRVLVPLFTRVVSGRIRTVSTPGLERVEVVGATRGVWVPRGVHFILGGVVPHLSVVSAVAMKGTSKETKGETYGSSQSTFITQKTSSRLTLPRRRGWWQCGLRKEQGRRRKPRRQGRRRW